MVYMYIYIYDQNSQDYIFYKNNQDVPEPEQF